MTISTMELFSLYPAIFDSLTVNNLRSVEPSANIQKMMITPGGSVDTALVAKAFEEPRVRLQSGDVGTILAAVSAVTGLAVNTTGEMQYQQRQDGGVFQSSNTHFTLNSTAGFLYITDFGAEQDSQEGADIQLEYFCLKEGANPPFTASVSQPLSGSPAVNALYALGPVVYEGAQLGGIQSWRCNTGITYRAVRGDGQTAASVGSIRDRKPTIDIGLNNLSVVNDTGFGSLKAVSSGITCYLQRVVNGGDRVAFGESSHIAVSVAAGAYNVESIAASGDGDATPRLMVTPTGTITVAVNTTIEIP